MNVHKPTQMADRCASVMRPYEKLAGTTGSTPANTLRLSKPIRTHVPSSPNNGRTTPRATMPGMGWDWYGRIRTRPGAGDAARAVPTEASAAATGRRRACRGGLWGKPAILPDHWARSASHEVVPERCGSPSQVRSETTFQGTARHSPPMPPGPCLGSGLHRGEHLWQAGGV